MAPAPSTPRTPAGAPSRNAFAHHAAPTHQHERAAGAAQHVGPGALEEGAHALLGRHLAPAVQGAVVLALAAGLQGKGSVAGLEGGLQCWGGGGVVWGGGGGGGGGSATRNAVSSGPGWLQARRAVLQLHNAGIAWAAWERGRVAQQERRGPR